MLCKICGTEEMDNPDGICDEYQFYASRNNDTAFN